MTQPNHREEAAALFARAKAALDATADGGCDPVELAAVGILGALLAIDDDPLNAEEQHQSEKFEASSLDDDTIETRYAIPLEDDEQDPRHQRP